MSTDRGNRIQIIIRVAAAVVSGLALANGYGLDPFWPLAWLAPIPLLVAIAAVRWPTALGLGAITGAIASLSLVVYLASLGGPADAALVSLLRAAQWGGFAVAARAAQRHLPAPVAVFVFPALLAGFEVVQATISPHGSGGSIAYSQMEAIPVIQVASLGGTAAIAFVIGLFASAIAFAIEHIARRRRGRAASPSAPPPTRADAQADAQPDREARGRRWWPALAAPAAVLVAALGFGIIQVAPAPNATGAGDGTTASGAGPRIALIATDAFDSTPDDWRAVWSAYAAAIDATTRQHEIDVAVLPEKLFAIDSGEVPTLLDEVAALAVAGDAAIALGVTERADDAEWNRTYLVTPTGEVVHYDKRHLIPGFESHFATGDASVVTDVAGAAAGLAICKDMDFPATIREYAAADAAVMLVPAWDFDDDAWFHSRIAVLRGVENGMHVARSAREGFLTLSDANGRVIAEAPSTGAEPISGEPARYDDGMQVVVATAPTAERTPTIYAQVGDVFGWAALAFALGALGVARWRASARRARAL